MKIAHLSDPHILDLRGVPTHRLVLNKRLTGMVNVRLKRGHAHKREVVEAMVEDIRARGVDHVIVTGDLTNLALESEFIAAREVLSRLAMPPSEVSVIPGNHDLYTSGAHRARRFQAYFAEHVTSDVSVGVDGFPFVRIRGPAAIIGLSTAVPRLPLVSSGVAGRPQRDALAAVLSSREVVGRLPVVAAHHPVVNARGAVDAALRGLYDAGALRALLARSGESLALHGHLHRRGHEVIELGGAKIHRLGATSASLLHEDRERMAAYNVYEVAVGKGLVSTSSRVWDPSRRDFFGAPLPPRGA